MNISSLFDRISIYEWAIIALYLIFFIVQLFYYIYLFRKPYQHIDNNTTTNEDSADNIDSTDNETNLPGVSIIITAKDEAENLRKNLPFILKQDYHNLQVIVVNNASTDTTDDVLKQFSNSYPNFYATYIPINSNAVNAKKLALTVGIKAAKHDILLFTEADTKPLTEKWVYQYAKTFKTGTDIVLGCCQMELNKGFFKKYILFDNLVSGVKYVSMALSKKPYMGIGRNMAFRKDLFFRNKGYSSVLNIEDGEDNVFINRIATPENTAILSSPQSMVATNAIEGITNWKDIKTKYLATRKYYTGKANIVLSFEVFSRYAFYLLFATLCTIGIVRSLMFVTFLAILVFLVRYLVQLMVINKNSKLYNAGQFYLSLPLFDLLTPIVNYFFLTSDTNREKK